MKFIACIRCKGKGVLVDKLDVDGGVYPCNLCNGTGDCSLPEEKVLTKEEREKEMLAQFEL